MALAAGSRLGNYEILSPLGAGGMGEVYRARDARLGRDVAVKVLPALYAENEDRLRRFELEARAAGVLNHPNLLTVFDVGTHERQPFIVSELLEGETLRDRMAAGALSQRKAIDLAVQIAAGVAAAHDKGIVHRDLKPENVFVTAEERVKLLDFGLAKVLDEESVGTPDEVTVRIVTDAGAVIGTPGYMSPEQVRGERLDPRTDVFSFGVVLYEMLSGAQPFRRASRVETMNATLHDDPTFPDGFPPALERVIRHALEKKPALRFQSMRDAIFALETFTSSDTWNGGPSARRAEKKRAAVKAKPVSFQKITHRRGFVMSARFLRDGNVAYGAAWEDQPVEVFSATPGDPHHRSLGLPSADVLAVSPTSGELAISLGRHYVAGWVSVGTLARVPQSGGAPREIAEAIQDADWSPDGKNFAISRRIGDVFAIEYPIGRRIYESAHFLSNVRLSPKGDLVAFIEHPLWGDDGGYVTVMDLDGNRRVQGTAWGSMSGLAWSPKGDEVWTAAEEEDGTRPIRAISLSGKERVVFAAPGRLTIYDAASNGGVLLSSDSGTREVIGGKRGVAGRNLSWFDWSFPTGIAPDGSRIVFEEQRGARLTHQARIYVRPLDGSPAVHLGDGRVRNFSPDGKWVLAKTSDDGTLELLPVGPGQPRRVPCKGLEEALWWYFFPDGKRILLWGNEENRGLRLYELALDGDGTLRPVGPEGAIWPVVIAPDGRRVALTSPERVLTIYDLAGNDPPVPVRGAAKGDQVLTWGPDDGLYVHQFSSRISTRVERIDLRTGERTLWHELAPNDPAGVMNLHPVYVAMDLETYAFSYRRFLSELYVARNLGG